MSSKGIIRYECVVVEQLRDAMFRVETKDDKKRGFIAYASGKMRKYRIKILVGDVVICEMSELEVKVDPKTKVRIVERSKA